MAAASDPGERRLLALAYATSTTLTGPVLLGLLIDWLADTLPWFTVGGVFLGMGGLFALLIRLSQPRRPPA